MIPLEIIKNRLGIVSLPSFCTFDVTWRCNSRCKMCNVWQKPKEEEEMTLPEITNIFQQQRFDVVKLTGGEPFLRDDLVQITKAIQRYGWPGMIHISSNGMLTDRILAFFNEVGPAKNIHIKISLDAVGQKHDEIRGVPAFQSVMTTLSELSKLREKLGFYLGINQTLLNKDGLENYWQVKEISQRLNVPIHPALAHTTKVALFANENNVNLLPKEGSSFDCFDELPKEQIAEMLNIIRKEAESISNFKERLVRKYYLNGLYNRLVKKKDSPKPACVALKNHLRILPNGDVPVCFHNSTVVGNLRKTPLRDLWFSEEMKKYRQMTKQCSGCWSDCEVIPSAVYGGDIIKGLLK